MSETYPFCLKFLKKQNETSTSFKTWFIEVWLRDDQKSTNNPYHSLTLDSTRFLKFPQINDLWILNFNKMKTREEDNSMKEITLKLNRSDNLNFINW